MNGNEKELAIFAGLSSLIFAMATEMKAAGLLTPELISEMEAAVTVKLKNTNFEGGSPDGEQIGIIKDALMHLNGGLGILRGIANSG